MGGGKEEVKIPGLREAELGKMKVGKSNFETEKERKKGREGSLDKELSH